jgi:hypothetical protein
MKSLAALSIVAILAVTPTGIARQLEDFRLTGSVGHFDITCAPELDTRAFEIGHAAERAYQRVASSLQHELSLRPLLVVFATRAEFESARQTRTMPGNREHLTIALDVPEARIDGLLVHELSHIFLFEMLPPSLRSEIPEWIMEGLAEHHRGELDPSDRTALREMIRTGSVPALGGAATPPAKERTPVIVGHAAFDFLVARTGPEGPTRMLTSLREDRERPWFEAYLAALRLESADFDREFGAYLRERAGP